MKRYTNLFLALGSGLLLWAAWPVSPLTFLIFMAWIPLLWLETRVKSRKKFFGLTYITMFVWNVTTTWWIWNASAPGAVAAFLANSLIMCLPWLGYMIVKKWKGEWIGYLALIAFWMSFEFIHLTDWGLSWPWLTLGNAFATQPGWIQWYEYTGSSGGTLWILAVNILLFLHIKWNYSRKDSKTYKFLLGGVVMLIIPIGVSLMSSIDKPGRIEENIVVVQPNIDPYVKVSDQAGSFEYQLNKLVSLSEALVDSNTKLVVWPETALYMGNGIDEATMRENMFLGGLWGFLKRNPQVDLFTGIESFRTFPSATKYSREYNGIHYEAYNGSVLLDSNGAKGFYHKSMLVPGVETLPWFLKFIDKWFEKFGGTTAGYARQDSRTVLEARHGIRIAPSICYESVYGEFMARYSKNGANLICIVTNDGWWKNTPGHKQHMNYARLRAIESHNWVARSANTGISCFIDPAGYVHNPQPWDTESSIKLNIPLGRDQKKTFFVRNGDILSRVMLVISNILLIWILVLKFKRRFGGSSGFGQQ